MVPVIPAFELDNGTRMPGVGLGCWMGAPDSTCRTYDMCEKALKLGYRHFDTAAGYGNEEQAGKAIRDSGIPRDELYITTKLANQDHHRVREAFEQSLKNLGCDYIDLYLLHWPQGSTRDQEGNNRIPGPEESPTFIETYKEMEKLFETGKVKSIGVSNFSIKTLSALLLECKIVPAVNQVEMHPCWPQEELKAYCEAKEILLTAYSPLGRSSVFFEHPVVNNIAKQCNTTVAQVILAWGLQRKTVVIPKSENEQRLKANISLIELSAEDMRALDEIHLEPGKHRSLLTYHSASGTVFGWTYEQLGWNMTTGGVVPS